MRHNSFFVGVLLALGTLGLLAQKPVRPNFAGEWVLDPARSSVATTAPPAGRGESRGAPPATLAVPARGTPQADLGPVRVGGEVKPPTKTKDVPPRYPQAAMVSGISGVVILDAVIGKDGKVKNLRILKSVPGLDEAARDAVSQWEYSPTLLNGDPIDVIMSVTVNFAIVGGPGGSSTPVFGGRGAVGVQSFTIKQDDKTLKMTRSTPAGSATITYRLDGKESKNRLIAGGPGGDVTYTYTSAWEGDVLVSRIVPPVAQAAASGRKETIALEDGALVVRTYRVDEATGAESVTQTSVFRRK